jgi:MerR family mercuric resistance operon transcriptional regulator
LLEEVEEMLTIGELGKAAGVPTSTVRYYEREGILKPRRRSASNYRLYSEEDAQRLRFIRAAQATGFTLEDMKELLRPAPCDRVQGLIARRLEVVEGRMRELRHVRRVLRRSLEECREHERTGRCRVVDDLSIQAKQPRG